MKKVLVFVALGLLAFGSAFAQTDVNGMETEQEKVEKEDTPVNMETRIIQVANTHPEEREKAKNTASVEIQYTTLGRIIRITYKCPRASYQEDDANKTIRACMLDFLRSMDLGWSDVTITNPQGTERNFSEKQANGKKMKMTSLFKEYYINR